MTAPAAGAVVEGSSRDGDTSAARSLEKRNALENWANIQSSLENKQACDSLFLAERETRTNQTRSVCISVLSKRGGGGRDDIGAERLRKLFEFASARPACWGSCSAKSKERFLSPNLLLCVMPGSPSHILGIAALYRPTTLSLSAEKVIATPLYKMFSWRNYGVCRRKTVDIIHHTQVCVLERKTAGIIHMLTEFTSKQHPALSAAPL